MGVPWRIFHTLESFSVLWLSSIEPTKLYLQLGQCCCNTLSITCIQHRTKNILSKPGISSENLWHSVYLLDLVLISLLLLSTPKHSLMCDPQHESAHPCGTARQVFLGLSRPHTCGQSNGGSLQTCWLGPVWLPFTGVLSVEQLHVQINCWGSKCISAGSCLS